MKGALRDTNSGECSLWFEYAAAGNDWGLERLRHLVSLQDAEGKTALMHYVENGWYKRIYIFTDEMWYRDSAGNDALHYARSAGNEEACHLLTSMSET